MTTETFTKEQFEDALPNTVSWQCAGLIDGEYTYIISVNQDIYIQLRSSVDHSGYCADTGADSIRAWLVDADYRPIGSKVSKWTTRLPGWQDRMVDVLRQLWKMAKFAGYCQDCHIPMGVFKVKKAGKNKGRIFKKCRQCQNHFSWMEEF